MKKRNLNNQKNIAKNTFHNQFKNASIFNGLMIFYCMGDITNAIAEATIN